MYTKKKFDEISLDDQEDSFKYSSEILVHSKACIVINYLNIH